MTSQLKKLRKAIKAGSAYVARPEELDRNKARVEQGAPRRDHSEAEAKFKQYQNMQAKQNEQYEREFAERQRRKREADGYTRRGGS